MSFDELADWDAVETAARIAAGEVSAREVVSAAIHRAREMEPRIGAIAAPTYESALERADQALEGRLAGVPTFVKDLENIRGAPTRFGSAAVPVKVADQTAASVAQFLGSGAISLGKSTTSEFGLTATTEPVLGSPTRNPLALEHSAGGSSGGAAALVAAKVIPIAHASDGGGSIRIPAAFCGLIGLKASRGRLVDLASAKRMPVKISTYGVLTRTVRDTAAFYAAVEERDRSTKLPPIGLVEGPGDARLRVGMYLDGPQGYPVDPAVRDAVARTARALEGMGHHIIDIAPPYTETFADDFLLHWGLMAAAVELTMRSARSCDHEQLEPWTRGLAKYARERWWKVPTAIWRLRRFTRVYAQVFERCEVVLSPTTSGPAPRLGHLSPGQAFEDKLDRIQRLFPYTPVQNAAGGPAISLPAGQSREGLPLAIQLSAPHGRERLLLELAFALEG